MHRVNTAGPREELSPQIIDLTADRGDDTQPGDDDTSLHAGHFVH